MSLIKSPIVFTDLDGTLLDHVNYAFDSALPTLESLQENGIPVVFNTSKTQPESVSLAQAMGLCHPIIIENGGAIVVPAGYDFEAMDALTHDWNKVGEVIPLGAAITDIQSVLTDAERTLGLSGLYSTFSAMGIEEICALTGLDSKAAEMAKYRNFSEPIVWNGNEEQLNSLESFIEAHQLKIVQGGRFHHIIGDTDKCTAMVHLSQMYEDSANMQRQVIKIALGDSQNDREMLNGADIAVVVNNESGTGITISHENVIRTENEGPDGWREGIEIALSRLACV